MRSATLRHVQHHDELPFRFRTPPGWPSPSDDWVAGHPLVEPVPGWTPVPDVPPAPTGWVFWQTDRRALRAFLPPSARRLVVARAAGAVLAVLGLVAGAVASFRGSVLAFAVLPVIIAGVALVVVAGARLLDLRTATIREINGIVLGDGTPLDTPWDVPGALPFRAADPAASDRRLRRSDGRALALVAGAAALVLVAGVTAAAVPTSRVLVALADQGSAAVQQASPDDGSGGQGAAPGDPSSTPAAPDDGSDADHGDGWEDPQPFVTRDGAVTVAFLGDDDSAEATCGTVGVDTDRGCWSWYATGECDGRLAVTIGFSATEDGPVTRTVHRTVEVDQDDPAAFVETGTEQYAVVEDAACTDARPKSPMGLTRKDVLDPSAAPDGSWPTACDDLGCTGWTITSDQSCADAQAVYRVDEPVGVLDGPHSVAVESPVVAGRPVTIYAAGVLDQDEAQLVQVTCP